MIETHFIENEDIYGKLNEILSEKLCSFKILRTENGKPFIEGAPLFFCISHSFDKAVIAISDSPVGVDMEVITERKYSAILSRMCEKEAAEITNLKQFLKHWVVREAYIKMLGATLAEKLNKLSFYGGILYDDGKPVDCEITHGERDGCVYCICVDNSRKVLV